MFLSAECLLNGQPPANAGLPAVAAFTAGTPDPYPCVAAGTTDLPLVPCGREHFKLARARRPPWARRPRPRPGRPVTGAVSHGEEAAAGRPVQGEQHPDRGRLPGPLGPRKPNTSPVSTCRSRPATARVRPKVFVRPNVSVAAGRAGPGMLLQEPLPADGRRPGSAPSARPYGGRPGYGWHNHRGGDQCTALRAPNTWQRPGDPPPW